MARAGWSTLGVLLLVCANAGELHADEPKPAEGEPKAAAGEPASGAEPAQGDAPAKGSETPEDANAAPDDQRPTEAAYEPDQRGVIAPEPAPVEVLEPPQYESEAAPASDERRDEARRRFYLELHNGYSYLDPGALSPADPDWFEGGRSHHGITFGLAAGLQLSQLALGLRFEHGAYIHGAAMNLFGIESRWNLGHARFVPQLRLGVGWLILSGIDATSSAPAPGTLSGVALEPGIGGRAFLGDSLSLGGALDVSFSRTASDTLDAWGFELRLHVDVGVHF